MVSNFNCNMDICMYCTYIFPKYELKITGVKIAPKHMSDIIKSVKWPKFEEFWTTQNTFLLFLYFYIIANPI